MKVCTTSAFVSHELLPFHKAHHIHLAGTRHPLSLAFLIASQNFDGPWWAVMAPLALALCSIGCIGPIALALTIHTRRCLDGLYARMDHTLLAPLNRQFQ
jgi:hypothetical protein